MSICYWKERTLTVMVEKVIETGGILPGSCDVAWLVRLRGSQLSRWEMSDGGWGKLSCPLPVFEFIPFCSVISVVLFIIRRYRVVLYRPSICMHRSIFSSSSLRFLVRGDLIGPHSVFP